MREKHHYDGDDSVDGVRCRYKKCYVLIYKKRIKSGPQNRNHNRGNVIDAMRVCY